MLQQSILVSAASEGWRTSYRLRGYGGGGWRAGLPIIARLTAKPLQFRAKVVVGRLPNGLKSVV
jgi:hypothetical protein